MRRACLSGLVLAALIAAPTAHAGRIADLFSDGLFGLKWGATRDEIDSAFPGGEWAKLNPVMIYWVADTRPVLHVERGKKSRLGFLLNSDGRMNSVTVEFAPGSTDKWGGLLLKAQEAFGPMQRPDLERTAIAGMTIVEWDEDDGVKVVATSTPGYGSGPLTLSVSKVNFDEPKSKEDLGFK